VEAPARSETCFDHARRGLVISAVAVAVQFPADLTYDGGVRTAAVRLAWSGLLLALIPLVSARRPRLSLAAMHLAAVATAAAATVVIARSGGTASPRFTFLVALPLLVAVLLPDFPWVALTLGLAVVACGSTAVVLEPRPLAWLLEWILLASISTGFAVAGALAHRRSVRAEVRAERERSEVVARLAESDRPGAVL